VVIDIEAAGAEMSRAPNGHPECQLSPELEALGCKATLSDPDRRDELFVIVDGCDLPATTSLVSCAFLLGDETNLTPFVSSSRCTCRDAPCFETPGVCIDPDDDPGACESCANAADDDGNGLADCADANCIAYPDCDPFTTTSSSTSTTATAGASTSDAANDEAADRLKPATSAARRTP
jgi:hypothetical protein